MQFKLTSPHEGTFLFEMLGEGGHAVIRGFIQSADVDELEEFIRDVASTRAEVERLRGVLKEIDDDCGRPVTPHGHLGPCEDLPRPEWCPRCLARAALAEGVEKP